MHLLIFYIKWEGSSHLGICCFPEGESKSWSVYCRYRENSSNTFISMTFSILYTFFVIYSVLIAETLHTFIRNKQLFRNTKKPCIWFEGDVSLNIQINASPRLPRLNYW